MRILKLRFKNINSLAGENEIDFTDEVFTMDGLFAITGKTGAGKSSILDAIALALYGKTPRVEISGSENAVMTRGEKDCYAEITFEVAGKKWKSSWKQERARTGTLKQVERAIADENNNIVADKISIKGERKSIDEKTVNEKIIEILGLNFEQFTKVIMLAQGSFAAFLQADKNDKGELLEQITGTEIYGEISKKVFERNRIEKEKLDKILIAVEAIKVLSVEEITQLSEEYTSLELVKKQIDVEVQDIEKAKNWLIDCFTLSKQITEAKTNLPSLVNLQTNSKIKLQETDAKLLLAKEVLHTQEPIFVQLRALDSKIGFKRDLLAPNLERIKELNAEAKVLQQKITEQQQQLETATAALSEKQAWKANHLFYEDLNSKFSAIEKEHDILQAINHELKQASSEGVGLNQSLTQSKSEAKTLEETLNLKTESLANKTKTLEAKKLELTTVLKGKTISELQLEKDNITAFGVQLKAIVEHQKSLITFQKEAMESEQNCLQISSELELIVAAIEKETKLLTLLQTQVKLKEENIALSKTILSFEAHRQQLKDGEVCPLCGALEHPFALGNIPKQNGSEEELLKLKADLEAYLASKLSLEIKQAALGSNRQNQTENKEKAEHQVQLLTQKLQELLHTLNGLNPSFIIPIEGNKIEWLEAALINKQKEFKDIESMLSKAMTFEKEISALRDHDLPVLNNEKQLADKNMTAAQLQISLAEQSILAKNEAINILKTKQDSANSLLLKTLQSYQVDTLDALKIGLDQWNQFEQAIGHLTLQILEIQKNIQIYQNSLNNCQSQLEVQKNEGIELEKELQLLLNERKEIFGDKSVEVEENKLKNNLRTAETARKEAESEHQSHTTNLAKVEAIIAKKEAELLAKQEEQLTNKPIEELETTLLEKKEKSEIISQKMGGNQQALKANADAQRQSGEKLKEKEMQQEIFAKWASLDKLIGSGDGKKFRNFAQALTFEHLIALANLQLQKMSERYLLKRTGEISNPFELFVVDKFQNSEERTAQNLSGGEKFIVSLSLALGLANMASKNMRIDTMFIDEGFGTLDSDYLDVALSALSNLQSEGKIIGVISHLSELKERIATHIEVIPSGNGYSKIQITH